MSRARKIVDNMSAQDLETLKKTSTSRTEEVRKVERASILLLAATLYTTIKLIAATLGVSVTPVRNTIAKYNAYGIEAALNDSPRSGRPREIGDDARAWVESLACQKASDLGYAQELWTISLLTKHIRENCIAAGYECLSIVSKSTVWTILNKKDIKPHRMRYYIECHDENFDENAEKVYDTYEAASRVRESIDLESTFESKENFDAEPEPEPESEEPKKKRKRNKQKNSNIKKKGGFRNETPEETLERKEREQKARERVQNDNAMRENVKRNFNDTYGSELKRIEAQIKELKGQGIKNQSDDLKKLKKRKCELQNLLSQELKAFEEERKEREQQATQNSQFTGKTKGTAFFSFDEKPGIQAFGNITPELSPIAGHEYFRRDPEYKRLGTVDLLCSLDLVTGHVIPLIRDSHKSLDFTDHLKILHETYIDYEKIVIVMDNLSVHSSAETKKFLEGFPPGRFEFVFTPKHASWLNLIESVFGKLRVASKDELVERMYRYIAEVNEDPVIYEWQRSEKKA